MNLDPPHTRHNTSPKYKEHKQGEVINIPTSHQNTYYINTRPGRTPKKCISRRDTSTYNYYIHKNIM
jgi:hypothetical protein